MRDRTMSQTAGKKHHYLPNTLVFFGEECDVAPALREIFTKYRSYVICLSFQRLHEHFPDGPVFRFRNLFDTPSREYFDKISKENRAERKIKSAWD